MERGQLYTMEAVIGGMLILIALLFVVQALGVTPQSLGQSNQQAVNQQRALADGGLQSMNESTLRDAVLYWNTTSNPPAFHCVPEGAGYGAHYPGRTSNATCSKNVTALPSDPVPPNQFGAELRDTFGSDYTYNVYVAYNDSGTIERQRMVFQGQPGAGSVRASRSVMLFEDDEPLNATGHPIGFNMTEVEDASGMDYYVPNSTGNSSEIWNIVHVEVVAWQS